MAKQAFEDFRQEVRMHVVSAQTAINTATQTAGDAIKALVLEEIADLQPFPQIDVGHGTGGNNLEWDGKREKVEGIIVLRPIDSGMLPHFIDYFVLKRDGLCRYGFFFNDGPGIPNADHYGGEAAASTYLKYAEKIMEAIGVEKVRARVIART